MIQKANLLAIIDFLTIQYDKSEVGDPTKPQTVLYALKNGAKAAYHEITVLVRQKEEFSRADANILWAFCTYAQREAAGQGLLNLAEEMPREQVSFQNGRMNAFRDFAAALLIEMDRVWPLP